MQVEREMRKEAKKVGIDLEANRPTYFQADHDSLIRFSNVKGIEVLSTKEALKKYPWLKTYFWKAVDKEKDEYTKYSSTHEFNGYFIRAKKNVKTSNPSLSLS